MKANDEFIGRVEDYLVEFEGVTPLPERVIDAVRAELPRTRQAKASPAFMRMPPMLTKFSSRAPGGLAPIARLSVTAVAVVAIAAVGFALLQPARPGGAGGQSIPSATAQPSLTATAAPTSPPTTVAGPIDCENPDREVRDRVPVNAGLVGEAGNILGCSRDGTRLLVKKGLAGNLFVVRADGSETQVSEALEGAGSARPTGATISPDGSRVVYAGKTVRGRSCHDGALFAVDADGGTAAVLWKSQRDGIVRYPTFSPDGTQIAFVDGYCDSDHSVWVMNADGSDAHQIVSSDIGPLDGTFVRGLAWSAAGDRIAIAVDEGTFTFATDGSDFTPVTARSEYCWPGLRC